MATPTVFTIKLEGLGDSSGSMDDTTRETKAAPSRREGPTADDPRHEIPRGPATPASDLIGPPLFPRLRQGTNTATNFLNWQSNPFSGLPIPGQGQGGSNAVTTATGSDPLRKVASMIGAGGGGSAGPGGITGMLSGGNGAAAMAYTKAVDQGLKFVSEALTTFAQTTRMMTREMLANFQGDMVGARMAERQRHGELAGTMGDVAGDLGIPGGKAAGRVMRNIADARNALDERFKQMEDATRGRMKELSSFSPAVAREQATSDVAKFKRDIGEASILGGRYAGLAKEQREMDTMKQQMAVIEGLTRIHEQGEAVKKENEGFRKKLEGKLSKLPKEMADAIRALGSQESPVDTVLKGLPKPDVPAPAEDIDREARNRLNIPLLRR